MLRGFIRFCCVSGVTLWVLTASVAFAEVIIGADDANLQFTGRIGGSDPATPILSFPGTSVTARFTGSSLELILDDRQGKNWFSVFLDGDLDNPVVLELQKGNHRYLVADDLGAGPHTMLLYKRTEGWEGGTRFKGLVLADGGELTSPPPRSQRRIEFYGDSITSGMGVDAGFYAGDREGGDKNSFHSYAAFASRALEAEFHSISLSGIGLLVSGFNFTMPRYYLQKLGSGQNTSRWDFAGFSPQVVVINLGQNDRWNLHRLDPKPEPEAIVQACYEFLLKLRGHHPEALLVMAIGSMDAADTESAWPGYIELAVERMNQEHQDANVASLVFPFTGFRKHPRAEQQQANAELLVTLIRERLDW